MSRQVQICLYCVMIGLAVGPAQARFCTDVSAVGTITRGSAASVNALDRDVLEVRSVATQSRMVQQADVTFSFRIPEQVSLVDVAAMQLTFVLQANTTHVHTLIEGWNRSLVPINPKNKKSPRRPRGWIGLDTVTTGITQERFRLGIEQAKQFIDPKTRILKLRIRTKRETKTPFFIKVNAVELVGIRAEGLKDYGDLFLVDMEEGQSSFEKSLKKIKDDWDHSFNKGGRLIAMKDWESTEERKEKLKKAWRESYTKKGKVISFESQMGTKKR